MSVSKAWSVVCDDCETDTWCAGETRSSLLALVSKGWTFPFSDTGEALSFCPNCKYALATGSEVALPKEPK